MHSVQKIWPQFVVEGSTNLLQHTGQVKLGSFGTTTSAGSLLTTAALLDCWLDPSPPGKRCIRGIILGRLFPSGVASTSRSTTVTSWILGLRFLLEGGTCEGDTACTSSSRASTSIGDVRAPGEIDSPGPLPSTGELASKFTTTLSADPSCDCLLRALLVVLMLCISDAYTHLDSAPESTRGRLSVSERAIDGTEG